MRCTAKGHVEEVRLRVEFEVGRHDDDKGRREGM